MIETKIEYVLTCNLCVFRMAFPATTEAGSSGKAVAEQAQETHMNFHRTLAKNVRVLVPAFVAEPPTLEGVITNLYFDREEVVVAIKSYGNAWMGPMRSLILDRRKP